LQTWKSVSASAKDLVINLMQVNPKKRFGWTQVYSHPWMNKDPTCVLPASEFGIQSPEPEPSKTEESVTDSNNKPEARSKENNFVSFYDNHRINQDTFTLHKIPPTVKNDCGLTTEPKTNNNYHSPTVTAKKRTRNEMDEPNGNKNGNNHPIDNEDNIQLPKSKKMKLNNLDCGNVITEEEFQPLTPLDSISEIADGHLIGPSSLMEKDSVNFQTTANPSF